MYISCKPTFSSKYTVFVFLAFCASQINNLSFFSSDTFRARKQLTLPSLHMYEVGQCKVDREGADSDASSGEQAAARDSAHSPLGHAASPVTFTRANRGKVSV